MQCVSVHLHGKGKGLCGASMGVEEGGEGLWIQAVM